MIPKRILLAEDDSNDELLIRRALTQCEVPCQIDLVRDGAEVLDYLFATGDYSHRDKRDLPDLIILDLKMPKMSGLQVLQVLRRVRFDDRSKLPPVVVLTSSSEEQDIVEAYRWGAHSYIRKPVDFAKFSDAVRRVIAYWLELNQPPHRRATNHAV